MQDKNGGAAFPQSETAGDLSITHGGMTLRDYFAAKAVSGLIAGSMADGSTWDDAAAVNFAKASFKVADAMLAERAK